MHVFNPPYTNETYVCSHQRRITDDCGRCSGLINTLSLRLHYPPTSPLDANNRKIRLMIEDGDPVATLFHVYALVIGDLNASKGVNNVFNCLHSNGMRIHMFALHQVGSARCPQLLSNRIHCDESGILNVLTPKSKETLMVHGVLMYEDRQYKFTDKLRRCVIMVEATQQMNRIFSTAALYPNAILDTDMFYRNEPHDISMFKPKAYTLDGINPLEVYNIDSIPRGVDYEGEDDDDTYYTNTALNTHNPNAPTINHLNMMDGFGRAHIQVADIPTPGTYNPMYPVYPTHDDDDDDDDDEDTDYDDISVPTHDDDDGEDTDYDDISVPTHDDDDGEDTDYDANSGDGANSVNSGDGDDSDDKPTLVEVEVEVEVESVTDIHMANLSMVESDDDDQIMDTTPEELAVIANITMTKDILVSDSNFTPLIDDWNAPVETIDQSIGNISLDAIKASPNEQPSKNVDESSFSWTE